LIAGNSIAQVAFVPFFDSFGPLSFCSFVLLANCGTGLACGQPQKVGLFVR
jgi:hypothetical protein